MKNHCYCWYFRNEKYKFGNIPFVLCCIPEDLCRLSLLVAMLHQPTSRRKGKTCHALVVMLCSTRWKLPVSMLHFVNRNIPPHVNYLFSCRQYLYGLRKTTLQLEIPKLDTNFQKHSNLFFTVQKYVTVYKFSDVKHSMRFCMGPVAWVFKTYFTKKKGFK